MKNKMKNICKIVSVGLVLMALSQSTSALGLAVSPSMMEIDNAMKGVEYERTMTIFNSGEEAYTCSLGSIGEMNEWIQFHSSKDLTTPISEISVPGSDKNVCIVKFKIPEDVATGKYTSKIYVETVPTEGLEGSGQMVKLKMSTDVNINVIGTQILTGTVKGIITGDTEVNYPLRIKVEFQNTGNVVAKPEIEVKISKDGTMVDSFTYSETGVKVDSKEIIPVEWDTTGKESGDYEAIVTVSLGGNVLATKELPFKLMPIGTLSRQGSLTGIVYDGEPSVGKVIKVLGTFRNTGEIDTKAKFIGEEYVDGDLVGTINSEELLVPVGESGTLTSYLKLEKDGSYTIKGHALYEGKTTEPKELSFVVRSESELTESEKPTESVKPTKKPLIPGFEAVGVIIAIASGMVCLRYRRRKSL